MTQIETNVIKPPVSFNVKDTEYLLIEKESEENLDIHFQNIETYIRENNGKGKEDSVKDELYGKAQELWKELASNLRSVKYNFNLNRSQFNFLTNLLLTKIEYDVNTVFFAIELSNLLGGMKDTKFSSNEELISFKVDATEITYIYHLISNHKVKGLTKEAYTFSEILLRIGQISKLINYYDATSKNLSEDIQKWVATFEEGVSFDKLENKKVS